MKELNFICAQPDDAYYTWQVHLWLENLKENGWSDRAIVLIFTPSYREENKKWKQVEDLYPEAKFVHYKDKHDISSLLGIYIPVLRPYCLWRYWKDHPEMENKPVLYCDSDILFTKDFNIDDYIDDDICYLSDTRSYINATYFDSKVKDVLSEKKEEYKKIDVLNGLAHEIGISREIAEKNNESSGGAQYLLKNIDAKFWHKVMNDCIVIRRYLQKINRDWFESENKGFQSWCADMWAVLWNLWLTGHETKIIDEMNFAWAPDPLGKLDTHHIYHNAGITGEWTKIGPTSMVRKNGKPYELDENYPCFYKGKYHTGRDPMKDEHLDVVLNHEVTQTKCIWYYANALNNLKNKYNLNY